MLLSNYLFFVDRCEEALKFYEACGLGKIVEIQRHGENEIPVKSETMLGKIMHARFEGDGVAFYASDNDDAEPMRGSAHHLAMDDKHSLDRMFSALGSGGVVTTALGMQPWGDYYGKLTDRFGVQWMLNYHDSPRI